MPSAEVVACALCGWARIRGGDGVASPPHGSPTAAHRRAPCADGRASVAPTTTRQQPPACPGRRVKGRCSGPPQARTTPPPPPPSQRQRPRAAAAGERARAHRYGAHSAEVMAPTSRCAAPRPPPPPRLPPATPPPPPPRNGRRGPAGQRFEAAPPLHSPAAENKM